MRWIGGPPRAGWRGKAGRWAVVILFAATVVVTVWAYLLSHPEIAVPGGNRHDFARVGILIDGTRSMQPQNFPLIKRIVREKLIPSLGMNDLAVAYEVRRDFTPAQNAVFGVWGDQMPQDSPNRRAQIVDILERHQDSGRRDPGPGAFFALVRSLPPYTEPVEKVQRSWAERVARREEPRPRGSDICSPLRELGEFLRDAGTDQEPWLFVLSDMQNTGPGRGCHPDDVFPNARIVLIYPFDPTHPSWPIVEAFWQPFFGNRKLERRSFSTALADQALLPPNPTAGLARAVPTMWQAARPLCVPALLLAIGLTAVIAGFAAFAWPRSDTS
jgi:hypothetical protein